MTMFTKMVQAISLLLLLVALASTTASAEQKWGAITAAEFTHRGREAKGYVGLGATQEDALRASAKACVAGTSDYNGKQRCKKQLWAAAGPANGYFVAAVCNFTGLYRTAVGAGKTIAAAKANLVVNAKESLFRETYSLKNRPLTECDVSQTYHGTKRVQ